MMLSLMHVYAKRNDKCGLGEVLSADIFNSMGKWIELGNPTKLNPFSL